jgi:protein involved in polysaccharide export with SLBB domain
MKLAQKRFTPCLGPGACLLAGFLLTGCGSSHSANDPVNPSTPYVFPGQTTAGQYPPPPSSAAPGTNLAPVAVPTVSPRESPNTSSMLRSGDTIMISFSDLPPPGLLPITTELGADGKITLPFNIVLQALGKTTRQLEQEIRAEYVPKYYKYLTVTVKPEMRFFHVNGEVKVPAAVPYRGETSVVRAIGAAGGFTDFARRSKILLTRSNGEKQMIDYDKALKDPRKDLPVYPGDHINVPRRW